MRRIGVGGLRPECYEPVAITDLLDERMLPVT
jgi:hypothetical protein